MKINERFTADGAGSFKHSKTNEPYPAMEPKFLGQVKAKIPVWKQIKLARELYCQTHPCYPNAFMLGANEAIEFGRWLDEQTGTYPNILVSGETVYCGMTFFTLMYGGVIVGHVLKAEVL